MGRHAGKGVEVVEGKVGEVKAREEKGRKENVLLSGNKEVRLDPMG